MSILVENVCKKFGTIQALNHVNLEVPSGSLVALVGPSGSGKSTLLRMIAGLDEPDQGRIWLSGRDATYASVQERNIGFVFQNYALFKHLTVYQNIAFGLELRKNPEKKIRERVNNLLKVIQLEKLADRYPAQLSGGQKQRIALARALAIEPKVLLLDEPFGALDAKVRKELRGWIKKLHEDTAGMTTVFVTHDQQEAMEIAHDMVIFNQGSIEQVGTPEEIYDFPASSFVMGFMGPVNMVPQKMEVISLPKFLQNESSNSRWENQYTFFRPHDFFIKVKNWSKKTPYYDRYGYRYWDGQIQSISYGSTSMKIDLLIAPENWTLRISLSRRQFHQLTLQGLEPLQNGSEVYVRPSLLGSLEKNAFKLYAI
uniref:Putative transport protein n=1 Tax=Nephroselmis astigmatica TaxID=259378 RepID=A0A088CIF3_9CHLO|nr:putative transport protein [Nephroselmis astigmatica]AID67670.1 putative transport protein [Nephroselmis astigmatica]